MPYSQTILRATWVAFSMSLEAPVVGSRNHSSSATRPPSSMASSSIISLRVTRNLSSTGRLRVQPRARPREITDTLCTGSALGRACPTIAWPASW